MHIRPATTADIDSLMRLESHAITASHWTRGQYEQVFVSASAPRLALLIEEPPALQGFLVAQVIEQEWLIENIAIAGPARRRGLGTRLLGEFLDLARKKGAEAVLLEVRESNLAARALYEKWAFVESARRPGYYRDPDEDAVIYRLSFV